MTIPAQPFAKPVLSGARTEVTLAQGLIKLSRSWGQASGFCLQPLFQELAKQRACLEQQPALSAGIQAILSLEERTQIWATKRDRGCVGSSLSCRGTVVLFVKTTTGIAWSRDAGR